MIFALRSVGLDRTNVPVRRLQTLTLSVEWITSRGADKSLNADTAAHEQYKTDNFFIIIHRGYFLFFSCSIENWGNCNIKACAY